MTGWPNPYLIRIRQCKANSYQQMHNALLLWQVGLIANVNLHFIEKVMNYCPVIFVQSQTDRNRFICAHRTLYYSCGKIPLFLLSELQAFDCPQKKSSSAYGLIPQWKELPMSKFQTILYFTEFVEKKISINFFKYKCCELLIDRVMPGLWKLLDRSNGGRSHCSTTQFDVALCIPML